MYITHSERGGGVGWMSVRQIKERERESRRQSGCRRKMYVCMKKSLIATTTELKNVLL